MTVGVEVRHAPDRQAALRLYDCAAGELDERDAFNPPVGRWFAYDEHEVPIGLATATVRSDDRLFVVHRLREEAAFAPLLQASMSAERRPIHVTIDRSARSRLDSAQELGFVPELESTSFDISFATAIAATERIRRTTRFDLVPADAIDTDRLFALDTELRQDVPGSDGWRGNRMWFDDELAAPEFDPSGYVVAREPVTGVLVGLVRFWRNEDGPGLGMLGVRRPHRSGTVAMALLAEGLAAASRWGAPTFETHTARPALQRRLRRLGAVETGGFVRLIEAP